ncbi:C40 family peptidase [Planococcus salinus]|uniref:Peptidoglycan endopeptidase n=1 Tax=Planococcus salinus TaxID=1848460 RepID=A0A3M8P9N9_9BACL|nr:LysM peptidoglycan-binding domain-containing C40 family peptidase [Planococcus salinus]RNF40387.1 peptidoglycan endopeptidase [Planococcus salinus]
MKKSLIIASFVLGTSLIAGPVSAATHTVKSGDTLSKIANTHNTSVSQLMRDNNLTSTLIFPNQKVKVNGGSAVKGAASPSVSSAGVLGVAKKYIGARYLYGASPNRTDAFDCSSFTQQVYSEMGVSLPRTSSAQAAVGTTVSKSNLQAGDLVFFATGGTGRISHTAVYAGNGQMISAQNGGVQYASINSSYWGPKFVTAKRVR